MRVTWEEREWEVLGRRIGSESFLGEVEGVGIPWEEEREWEVLGRRRGSGRSLGGGEGVGGPWEEREWEVLGRRRGSREVLVQSTPHMCTHCLWPTSCTHWSTAVRHHLRDTWSSRTRMGLVVTGVVAHRLCHFC